MTKLEQLIEELCPNGVEYKKLNEISDMKRGNSVTQRDVTTGDIPVISGGREPAYYCDVFNRDGETITVAGSGVSAGYVQYWTIPILVCDAFSVKGHDCIQTKYLYYCLANMQDYIYSTKKGGGVPHVHISSIEHMKIPVPPLEVQREIVRILDNFTELTAELTEELTEELTARKKQYAYYQNLLLSHSTGKMCTLADCCVSIADGDHQPPPKANSGVPFITISNFSKNGIDFADTKFVPQEYYDSLDDKRRAKKDDILYSVVGSFGIPVHIMESKSFVFQRHIAILRPNTEMVAPRYLYHVMKSDAFYKKADAAAIGAAQRTISLSALNRMKIVVPTMAVQKRLAHVLDNFDAICSDLKIGLSAEIEARKKQYEYYRDKLLTFKPL